MLLQSGNAPEIQQDRGTSGFLQDGQHVQEVVSNSVGWSCFEQH